MINSLGAAFLGHTDPRITHAGIKARLVALVPVSLKAGLTVKSMSCGGFFLSGRIYVST